MRGQSRCRGGVNLAVERGVNLAVEEGSISVERLIICVFGCDLTLQVSSTIGSASVDVFLHMDNSDSLLITVLSNFDIVAVIVQMYKPWITIQSIVERCIYRPMSGSR